MQNRADDWMEKGTDSRMLERKSDWSRLESVPGSDCSKVLAIGREIADVHIRLFGSQPKSVSAVAVLHEKSLKGQRDGSTGDEQQNWADVGEGEQGSVAAGCKEESLAGHEQSRVDGEQQKSAD